MDYNLIYMYKLGTNYDDMVYVYISRKKTKAAQKMVFPYEKANAVHGLDERTKKNRN